MIHQHTKLIGRQIFTALFFFIVTLCYAGEGMWLPFLLKSLNEAEMKSMGMKMSAEDIYSVNQGSLKDAVVHFGGFCTGCHPVSFDTAKKLPHQWFLGFPDE